MLLCTVGLESLVVDIADGGTLRRDATRGPGAEGGQRQGRVTDSHPIRDGGGSGEGARRRMLCSATGAETGV